MTKEPTWVVLVRDVSDAVRVTDQPVVVGGMVLDADTGLVRGLSMGSSREQACGEAMTMALSRPAGDLPPDPPVRVVHGEADTELVGAALDDALGEAPRPELFLAAPIPQAEEIFDSMLSHLIGRRPAADLPDPDVWEAFYAAAARFRQAEPWRRRSDADHRPLALQVDGRTRHHVAVVLGQAGIQRGLAVYAGEAVPDDVLEWSAGEPTPQSQSLVLWLDDPQESPADLMAKAERYGWAEDLVPVALAIDGEGVADLDTTGLRVLTAALDAVLDQDIPGPDDGQRVVP